MSPRTVYLETGVLPLTTKFDKYYRTLSTGLNGRFYKRGGFTNKTIEVIKDVRRKKY